MLKSMTGYGSSIFESPELSVKVEIKTLNSKMFDLKIRIPSKYNEKEIVLNKLIEKELCRGKIDATINIKNADIDGNKKLFNAALFKAYYMDVKSVASDLDEKNEQIFSTVLNLPDVFTTDISDGSIDEKEWEQIYQTTKKAIENVNKFRTTEGVKLSEELLLNLKSIEDKCQQIDGLKDNRTEAINKRLQAKLAEALNGDYDKNRFEQEIIYFLEKLDITEEIDRLHTHISYFRDVFNENENGRKLNFISQEIGREINTIGSKANDSQIQQIVVQMKNDLEKIKQQLANIL
ncbi:MAG: YicC family protein [Bacteroidetes bacterium]|nr:YicC family protein [Bacteroidota bacterium]MBT7994819.1 YicC family protein [Bacteroidota bacterium]